MQIGLRRMHLRRAKLGIGVDVTALRGQGRRRARRPGRLAARARSARARSTRRSTPTTCARQYGTVVTVDKASFKLRLFKDLKLRKSYGVAVGQPAYPTPTGRFTITNKQVDPVWSVPNSPWAGELAGTTVAGGSAANPLKARWMGITNGVGIHGTGEDWSIGIARLARLHPHARLGRQGPVSRACPSERVVLIR